ncbi:MAG: hypothetical protein ABR601_04905 [Parasphingopyxis sp.]
MQLQSDAMFVIRSDLVRRVEELERHCRAMTLPALHDAIDAIRNSAHEHGFGAVEDVARCFERSIARDRQKTAFPLYFDQLKFAAGCESTDDPAARETMLAAISVRLAG